MVIGIASLTATLLLARNVLTVLASPSLGYLSDRLGDRTRVLLLGELLGVGGLICFAVGASPWLLGIGVLGAAIAYGIVPPMLLSWLGDLTPSGRRGAVVGSYQTMGDLGSGLGPLMAYPLLALMDIRLIYALCAAALALTIPAIIKARRWSDLRHPTPDMVVVERLSQP
jgi:MFS family permease